MSILYLRSALSDISLGTNNTNKAGGAVAWRARALTDTVSTTANVTATVGSVNGLTNGLETGAPVNEWISDPLAAAVTISGTITFNICGLESNAMANSGLGVVVQRLNNVGTVVSTIVDSVQNVELGTANSRRTWTATPTSTAMQKGDRFRIRVYFDDAGGTMVSGYTLTLTYDGTAANTGNSNVDFAETLTFMSAPSPTGTFSSVSSGFGSTNILDVAFGNGLWVAVGDTSKLSTATDPTTAWTLRTPGMSSQLDSVAYGNGVWVVGGFNGVWTSSDPTQNSSFTQRLSLSTQTLTDFAFANSLWVAVGGGAGEVIAYTATDPTGTWVKNTLSASSGVVLEGVAYGNGLWVAVGTSGALWTSTDPAGLWTQRTSPTALDLYSVAYGAGRWVISAAAGNAWTSTDLTSSAGTWQTVTGEPVGIAYVTHYADNYGSGVWLLSGNTDLSSSTTGNVFSAVTTPLSGAASIFSAAHSSSAIVLVGQLGNLAVASTPPTTIYLTSTVSDIADQGATVNELTAWTSRGNG